MYTYICCYQYYYIVIIVASHIVYMSNDLTQTARAATVRGTACLKSPTLQQHSSGKRAQRVIAGTVWEHKQVSCIDTGLFVYELF